MSSGTRHNPGAVRALLQGLAAKLTAGGQKVENIAEAMQKIARLGMTPRQLMLNHLWSWYRCERYAARSIDWNGDPVMDPIEHEVIAHGSVIPPGFYSAGDAYPIKFRKPTAPYALVRVIVNRFTGLLFSERNHPEMRVPGDVQTEDFLQAVIKEGRLWPQMIQARTYGGGMGSVAVGFQFVAGKPTFEVHDPRWCRPDFADRATLRLRSIEKRYMTPKEELNEETGIYETVWYWYRRIITENEDIVFLEVPVGDGQEPPWIPDPEKTVVHGLGFCPVVWIQNLPVQDDLDGDPDCIGTYDMVEAMDALVAQANRGTLANCDPTLVLSTDAEMGEVQKGSDNAIKLPADGSGNYLEISGSGPKLAMEQAKEYRGMILEVAQCVLEHPEVVNRTATEIGAMYSSMLDKADVLREQYGEKGIKLLGEMILRAAAQLIAGRVDEEGNTIRGEIILPPKAVKKPDGTVVYEERTLGEGVANVEVQWPKYFDPTLTDTELATRAAIAARAGGLIDRAHAVNFVAEHYRVKDVPSMLQTIDQEREQEQEALAAQSLGMLNAPGVPKA